MAQAAHIVLGDAADGLGAVHQLTQVFRDDAGQVQVFAGFCRQGILARGGFLADVQGPEEGQGDGAQGHQQEWQEACGGEGAADHCLGSRPWV